jgi:hypothetical protein
MWKKKFEHELKGEGYCPHCLAELIDVGSNKDFDGALYRQVFTCDNCGSEGFFVFEYSLKLASYKVEDDLTLDEKINKVAKEAAENMFNRANNGDKDAQELIKALKNFR